MMQRRNFLMGLGAALVCAPAVIRTPGLLMPIRPYWDHRSMPPDFDVPIIEETNYEDGVVVRKAVLRASFGVPRHHAMTFAFGYTKESNGVAFADVSVEMMDRHLRQSMWWALEDQRVKLRRDPVIRAPQPLDKVRFCGFPKDNIKRAMERL